jgi:hypothetical protein
MSIIDVIQLSLSAIIMLTGLFMTFLGAGGETTKIKLTNPKWRKFFIIVGVPTLITGISLSVLWVAKELFEITLSLPKFEDFAWMFSQNLVTVYLWTLACGTLFYTGYWVISERLYKADGTLVNSSKYRANIRVDHKGGKSFMCVAKLEEVVRISRNGDREPQKLDTLNPDSRVLEWVDEKWNNKIVKGYPKVVRLVGVNEWNSYDSDKTHFVFYGATSPELNPKFTYEITIGIYRLRGWQQIKLTTVKGVLKISSDGLWLNAAEQSVHPTSGIRRDL